MEDATYPTPSWGALYTVVTLMLGTLGIVEALVPAGAWRRTLEVPITLAGYAALQLWIRVNRSALDLAGQRDAGAPPP